MTVVAPCCQCVSRSTVGGIGPTVEQSRRQCAVVAVVAVVVHCCKCCGEFGVGPGGH